MDNKEESKGKPSPKAKEKVIKKIEDVEEEVLNSDEKSEMVKVLVPRRASNGTIKEWEEKEVPKTLADMEIKKWKDHENNGGDPGHSAWRDVEYSN